MTEILLLSEAKITIEILLARVFANPTVHKKAFVFLKVNKIADVEVF